MADTENIQKNAEHVETYLRALQNDICRELAAINGDQEFFEQDWNFSNGHGGGNSRVLEDGRVFEKAGVNFSSIGGDCLPAAATESRDSLKDKPYGATGISVVVHPRNPYVPTTHMNLRFIQIKDTRWWFGGGFDLTPYYGFDEDAVFWHQNANAACTSFGRDLYARLKTRCDEYFFIKHRDEARGIGGIFFDDFDEGGFEHSFNFLQSVGRHFLKAYLPIVERRKNISYGERERQFQLMRRGRYVEFNLIYDRGTLFGLQSGGRVESILMSLPPHVVWRYDWQPEPGSAEHNLTERFLRPRDWLSAEIVQ